MAVIHSGGDDDKTAHSQKAGGGAQGGDDAPVFVDNQQEFFAHMQSVNPFPLFWMKIRVCFILSVPALAYALLFPFVGLVFPQFYQAWLDFCMPLVEYVAGLTPRAERISGQLIAGGYPERVDDARHGIAMARIVLFPFYIYFPMAFVVALIGTPPTVVSCSRQTHGRIWRAIFWFLGVAMFIFCVHEFILGETFGSSTGEVGKYNRGNLAIWMDIVAVWGYTLLSAIAFIRLLMMRAVRFNIKNYNTANWK